MCKSGLDALVPGAMFHWALATKMTERAMLGFSAKRQLSALVLGAIAISPIYGAGAQEINLYTYREPALIKPLLEAFTKETKVKVNTVYSSGGLEERLKAEGDKSPADVLLTVDIGRLQQAKEYGVTQPTDSKNLDNAVPLNYRDPENHWFGVSLRGRVVYASKNNVKQNEITYDDLADPKWKGRICTRSGQHLYNIGLFAAMIAHYGPEHTAKWLRGLKSNLAKKPSGGDRDVAKDIAAGTCDIGVGNTYYITLLRKSDNPEQRKWGEAVKVILPTFKDAGGTHVNVSGVAMARNAPNKENARKFMEFLVSDMGQKIHAQLIYEYPIKPEIQVDPAVAAFGELKPDALPIAAIAKNRKKASELVDKAGYDE